MKTYVKGGCNFYPLQTCILVIIAHILMLPQKIKTNKQKKSPSPSQKKKKESIGFEGSLCMFTSFLFFISVFLCSCVPCFVSLLTVNFYSGNKRSFVMLNALTQFIPSNFRGINLSGPSNFQCWGRKTGAPTK